MTDVIMALDDRIKPVRLCPVFREWPERPMLCVRTAVILEDNRLEGTQVSTTLFTFSLGTSGINKSLVLTGRLLSYELQTHGRCCRSSSCLLLDVLCSSYQHKEWNDLLHGCSYFPTAFIRKSICEPFLSHPPGDSCFCSLWLRGPSLCLLLQTSFPEVFPIGSISTVQNLFGLSTDEIAGLRNDFLTYLQVSWL